MKAYAQVLFQPVTVDGHVETFLFQQGKSVDNGEEFADIVGSIHRPEVKDLTSNMVIGVFIVILIFITMSLTVIVSSQKNKINLLIQEVSMLKQEIKDKANE